MISEDESLLRHREGGHHARAGFQYECGLHCLWILELRGTTDRLMIDEDEDAVITKDDATKVYRQAKKNDTDRPWRLSEKRFRKFVERAYGRFSKDSGASHEFYTNGAIGHDTFVKKGKTKYLKEGSDLMARMAGDSAESFCLSVVLKDHYKHADPKFMQQEVISAITDRIEQTYPGTLAWNIPHPIEYVDVASRVLQAEFTLCSTHSEVSWKDVDRQVRLDRFINDIGARSLLGGTLVPWGTIVEGPEKCLPPAAVEALASEKFLPRTGIEEEVCTHVGDWASRLSGKQRSTLRMVLLVGNHGSGKTWTLMHIARRVAEQYRGLAVCVASGPGPDKWDKEVSDLRIASPGPCVVFIDELFEGWDHLVSMPRYFLGDQLLFVASGSSDAAAFRLPEIRLKLGSTNMKEVPLPTTLSDDELRDLAIALRKKPPTPGELKEAKKTNIRHAREILLGEVSSLDHLAKFERLLSEQPQYRESAIPILCCSVLGLGLPFSLLQTVLFPKPVPHSLGAWFVLVKQRVGELIFFEDQEKARHLLEKNVGEGFKPYYYGELLQKCDPAESQHRAFSRNLLPRLARAEPDLLHELLGNNQRTIKKLLPGEPLWALAFCWLPTLAVGGMRELIREAVKSYPTSPQTAAEFLLWMELYRTTAAIRYLHERMEAFRDADITVVVRIAEMIGQLPPDELAPVARRFDHLWIDLPVATFRACILHRNAFGLLTSLLADYGDPHDREEGLKRLGAMLDERIVEHKPISQDWLESYAHLVDRTFSQGRSHLSLKISRSLANGLEEESVEEQYGDRFDLESRLKLGPLVDIGVKAFKDFMTDPTDDREEFKVPGNLLKVAAKWAESSEWEVLANQFLSTLETIGGLPSKVVSPILIPGFRAMKRGPRHYCETFLRAILAWAPKKDIRPTQETTGFMFKLLSFVAGQEWISADIRQLARSTLLHLATKLESGVEEGKEALKLLSEKLTTGPLELHLELGLVREWPKQPSLANQYLNQITLLELPEPQRADFADQIMQRWKDHDRVWLNLAAVLLRLGRDKDALDFARKLNVANPDDPNPYGLAAIAEARQSDVAGAYKELRTTSDIYDRCERGLYPRIVHWVHTELASVTTGTPQRHHLVCAELMGPRRLRPYPDLFAGRL
jgi:hypothetical protein